MAYNYEYPYVDPGMYNDDWLINKMKELAAEWEAMQVKFTTLEEYVRNYFANLDVQDEINNKIDAMIADGSFQSIIATSLPPVLFPGKSISIGGPFSYNSRFSTYSVIGYFSQIMTGNNTDLSSAEGGLLHPDNTSYYNIVNSYFNSQANKKVRFAFLMLEDSDIGAGTEAALNNLGKLISSYGGILFVYIQPSHSRSISLSDNSRLFTFLGYTNGYYRKILIPYPFLQTGGEIYVGNYLSSPGVTKYVSFMLEQYTNSAVNSIVQDKIDESDQMDVYGYAMKFNINVSYLYLIIYIKQIIPTLSFNFPVHMLPTTVNISGSGNGVLSINNNSAVFTGISTVGTYYATIPIILSTN